MTKIPPKSPKMTNFSGFSFWQVWKFKRLSHSVFVNSEKSRNRLFWSPLENPDVQKLINFLDRFWRFSGKTPKLKKPSYPRDVILEPRGSPEGVQKKGPKKGPKKGSPQIQGGPKTVKNGKFWKFQRLSHSVSVQKNQKKRTKSPGGLIGKIDFGGSKMGFGVPPKGVKTAKNGKKPDIWSKIHKESPINMGWLQKSKKVKNE